MKKSIKLGELFEIGSGGTPSKKHPEYYGGDIPWVKTGDLKSEYLYEVEDYITDIGLKNSSARIYEPETVLIAMYGATIGATSILKFPACTNQACAAFKPNHLVRPEYLYYFLTSRKQQFIKDGVGGAQPNISASYLKKVVFNLIDVKEQDEIIKVLNKVSSVIQSRKLEIEKLDELIKARFVELMNDNPSVNLLSEFISPYKAQRCGERELPVLSITKADGIVFQDEKFKKRIASNDASSYKVIPRGKLIQGIHIDERNFAIQNIADEGIVSPAYKVWTVNERCAIPAVLAYALRSDYAMAYISSKFTGSVKRRESISIDDFLKLPINLPSLEVQKVIYEFMQQVDKSKVAVQKSLDEAQLLFDSLMQQYFG